MGTSLAINLPSSNHVMTSPIGEALKLVLFKSKEGIEALGVTTYETLVTFREIADHFRIEENSDVLDEEFKKQRDVDAARINGLKKYWETSEGPVFPNMTIFTNELSVTDEMVMGNSHIIQASLDQLSDRFICDGQGRSTFIKWLMSLDSSDKYFDHTISVKLIVTGTNSLSEPKAVKLIRQVFADYHVSLRKPNKSISKHFDTGSTFSRFLNELLDIEINGAETIKKRIALHGKIKQGHLWSYDQFTSLIQKFLKLTPSTAQKHFAIEGNYETSLELCRGFLCAVFSILPVNNLDVENYNEVHEGSMFTKAIFANALGFIGRSLFDEMLLNDELSWNKLKEVNLPLDSKEDKFWLKNKVTMSDDGAIKIIKGTDRRIGSIVCRDLRIFPCPELTL
ncbi:DGQHR domain-containing protein [Shewanella sp. UCD-KL12]|uniref:DGQHR domain-containing protein n=1 Tax=Shewanella sp. UCD-KL12 TaxID=1917163 RepID=UPI0009F846B9|nr:DGQHR domain-containing protein [Shewanella sp. UCD-KL12]